MQTLTMFSPLASFAGVLIYIVIVDYWGHQ